MSDTRYCPECGQTGSGPYCHHWDAGTERKIATLVRPPDLMAALERSLAQIAYDQHVARCEATRGRHSNISCPLNTRALCTFHIALNEAKSGP